ncbi:Signal transduction histidine kinase [Clostridium sp. DSM 8431]|uniref:sensor histidine kinase n=1 Tax=Clostridium sp. DSM 8431 TaxID=1761781 RepID=UPI0008E84BB2|nr:HAMP domain-containing sensor histidine kinase [Clostridium sp. DSM 8431]SFU67667.1 Signal transduction histidine kinase [Clostridium sp. DSM 8431]
MKKGLVYKIQVKSISVLSIFLIVLGNILSISGIQFLKENRIETLDKQIYPITIEASNYLRAQQNSSFNSLQNILNAVGTSSKASIMITDNLGYTYAVSNEEENESKSKLLGKIITDEEREILINGEAVKKADNEKFIYMKPVFQGDYFGGVIITEIPEAEINSGIIKLITIIWGGIFLAIIFTSIGINHFIKNIVVKPINEISKVAKNISIGEISRIETIHSDDEIGELTKSFNIIADFLSKSEIKRKNFISNISHELRSPITSIRGFIAGILDGIIPIDKEKYYLSIVYDEVKRISRLVDDLLDISTLDDSNYILKKSEIDINGLIEICLVNKEAQIAERDLKVEVILNENHQFVYADRDRMIQVLTNLIDNAIKYSYSGEIIRIETSVKGKKVYVSIKNKGKGISEEELVRIWDRFYKSDSSRTNKESTGLGLSIVRTILSRHGEDIWVNSKDGETEFIFTLSKA